MAINIFLSTTLRDAVAGYQPTRGLIVDFPAPIPVGEVAMKIGLPIGEIRIIMINGRKADMDDLINDGDRVGFFPAVGGG